MALPPMQPAADATQARELNYHDGTRRTVQVSDREIAAVLSRKDLAAQECVDHLIIAALDGGGSDNITAILVRAN